MMLSLVGLLSGCSAIRNGDYCDAAQRPYEWGSAKEVRDTSILLVRYIEIDADIWHELCKR